MDTETEEYRDYATETFEAVAGCTTPEELRQALWNAGLHVGRRPDTEVGQDWRVGLLRALSTSEDEEASWVVSETMPISLALLDDVRARERIAELEHDQERFEQVLIETWGAAGGGDVADLATLCDRLPYRVEQLLSRVRLLEAALREYEGLPWVEELPDSYHAFTDKVNKLLDEDAPEEPSLVEAVCEALSHLDHITHGNAEYSPDALAAAAALRRAFGNV